MPIFNYAGIGAWTTANDLYDTVVRGSAMQIELPRKPTARFPTSLRNGGKRMQTYERFDGPPRVTSRCEPERR